MALFGKKKRTLDEILTDIKSLTPEEKAQLQEKMSAPEASDGEPEVKKVEESATDTPEVAEEVTKENAEDTPDEAAGVDEVPPTEPGTEPTPEVDEAPEEVDAEPIGENNTPTNEAFEAMAARITTIEENYSSLIEKIEAMAEKLDGGDFGNIRGMPPEGNEDSNGEDSRVMRSYYRKQGDARRY